MREVPKRKLWDLLEGWGLLARIAVIDDQLDLSRKIFGDLLLVEEVERLNSGVEKRHSHSQVGRVVKHTQSLDRDQIDGVYLQNLTVEVHVEIEFKRT